MHWEKKKEYRTIALCAIGVLVISALIIVGGITRMDFSKYIGILTPFFYAFAIAYLLDHIVGFFKRLLHRAANRMLGDKTGLSAFWVLASLIIMGGLYGVVGMLLAVQICSVVYYEVKIIAERKLASRSLPTDTADYADENEKLLIPKSKNEDLSARVKTHVVELEKIKKKKGNK
ncbi:MAG: hypothetical protein J6L71_01065 [Clostridia bacterium]|nr:hypothetical protein [Clostridia bacterium]